MSACKSCVTYFRNGRHLGAALALSLVCCSAFGASNQQAEPNHGTTPGTAGLTQLNGKRSVLLLVLRTSVLDTHGEDQESYPYGELIVIIKQNADAKMGLGVVWKSRKIQWAGDAIKDLIKDLKTARGEL